MATLTVVALYSANIPIVRAACPTLEPPREVRHSGERMTRNSPLRGPSHGHNKARIWMMLWLPATAFPSIKAKAPEINLKIFAAQSSLFLSMILTELCSCYQHDYGYRHSALCAHCQRELPLHLFIECTVYELERAQVGDLLFYLVDCQQYSMQADPKVPLCVPING